MGTTLTGTKPKDTYDSLIKVGDNGPISGTAKTLSDGLGNDLPISVSTSNVGIGTSSPDTLVTLGSTARTDNTAGIKIFRGGGTASYATYGFSGNAVINSVGGDLVIQRESSERARFTTAGLCFNGDFAAANALDDYEEGTFTPSVAFGGASTGITYFDQVGVYTKIGRQVTCTIYVALTNVGSATGNATLQGLPFANGNVNRGSQSAGSIRFDNITYGGSIMIYVPNSSTNISFAQVSEAGSDSMLTNANFNNDSEMSITITYFTA
jgi:hypothetical protein